MGLSNGNYTLPENPFKLYQIAPAALYIPEQSVEYRGTRALEVSGMPTGGKDGATGVNGEALSGGFIVDAEALRSWDTSGSHRFHITFKPESAYYVDVTDFVLVTVVRREVAFIEPQETITGRPFGTAQADLGLPAAVTIATADGKTFENVPVVWSGYNASTLMEQTLTGQLDLRTRARTRLRLLSPWRTDIRKSTP